MLASKLKFVLILYLGSMIFLHVLLFLYVKQQARDGYSDFSIFYGAARILLSGQGGHLYENGLQLEVQRQFAPVARAHDGPLPYNHPPFEALFYLPFSYLPYWPAYLAWGSVNLLLLCGTLFLLRRHLQSVFWFSPWVPFMAILGFFPAAVAVMQGQDSILLLMLYSLTFLAMTRGSEFAAGCCLAFGLFKFHLVLPFVAILLLRRRMKFILGFLLVAGLLVLLSAALVGWKELVEYPRYVWQVNQSPPIKVIWPRNMPNLRGLIAGWTDRRPTPFWLDALILVTSSWALLWAAKRFDPAQWHDSRTSAMAFALAVIVTFLVGYHGYSQDLSILLLPLLLVAEWLFGGWKPNAWIRWSLLACLGVLFCTPIYVALVFQLKHLNVLAAALLLLAASLGRALKSEQKEEPVTVPLAAS